MSSTNGKIAGKVHKLVRKKCNHLINIFLIGKYQYDIIHTLEYHFMTDST